LEIACDKRFFLGPRPTFELPLSRNGINYPLKFLVKDECNGAASRGVTSELTRIMLRNALLERCARAAHIV
jgi:hypothetical protein